MSAGTGAIVGSNLVSLYDGMDSDVREDLFDCLLHAHTFASRYHDQRDDYSNWMFRYRTRLESRGCELLSAIRHTPQVIFHASDLDSATFRIIDSAGSRALANLATASWRVMKFNRHAGQFFSSGTKSGEVGRFQIVPCVRDPSGEVLMLICAIRLTKTVEIRDFDFWTDIQREMLLRISGGVYRFNRTVYGGFREQIRAELIKNADRAISEFPI